MGSIFVIVIIILYSCVWFVPLSLSSKRRKKGEPVYWLLLLFALILEIGVIYFFFLLQEKEIVSEGVSKANVFIAPIVASVIAGMFYYLRAKKLDEKNT